jgi:hypothetical protein
MKRFVEGADRGQSTLWPECLDEWVEGSNSVRVVDCFVDGLDLADLGFEGVEPAATGRPAYHPSQRVITQPRPTADLGLLSGYTLLGYPLIDASGATDAIRSLETALASQRARLVA